MNKKKNLIKNTAIIFIGKVCTQLMSFLLLPLYTAYLISSEFGIVDLITTYVSLLVPVLSLQIEMSVFRFLIDSRDNNKKIEKIINTNLNCLLTFIFITIILFIPISLIFKIKFGGYILGIIIVTMIVNDLMQISRGIGNNLLFSFVSCLIGVLCIIFNVVFITILKYGAVGMLLATLLSNLIGLLILVIKLKIYKFNIFKIDKELKKNMIKYSIPLVPNGISWWVMNASDRTIVSIILGISATGIYAISNKFPTLLNSFFGIFNLAWSESVSLYINSNDKDEYISSVCNDVLKIFGYLGILLILFMNLAFNFLVNSGYNEAYYYIPILILSSFFSLMAAQYGSIYIAKKETKSIAITTFVSAIVNIFTHLLFIKSIGLYAAAISTVISYFVIMVYRHLDTKKYVKIKYDYTIIIKIVFLYCLAFILYYYNNKPLCIASFFIISILFIYDNKKLILNVVESRLSKKGVNHEQSNFANK